MKESVLLPWDRAPCVGEMGGGTVTLQYFSWVLESSAPLLAPVHPLPPPKTNRLTRSTHPSGSSPEESDQQLSEGQSRTRNTLLSFCFPTSNFTDSFSKHWGKAPKSHDLGNTSFESKFGSGGSPRL